MDSIWYYYEERRNIEFYISNLKTANATGYNEDPKTSKLIIHVQFLMLANTIKHAVNSMSALFIKVKVKIWRLLQWQISC